MEQGIRQFTSHFELDLRQRSCIGKGIRQNATGLCLLVLVDEVNLQLSRVGMN